MTVFSQKHALPMNLSLARRRDGRHMARLDPNPVVVPWRTVLVLNGTRQSLMHWLEGPTRARRDICTHARVDTGRTLRHGVTGVW